MEFRILGPLEVRTAEGRVPLGGAKQRATLALLVLQHGEVVATDRLIEELWDERPPPTAATALQGYVSALRKLLEPARARGEAPRVLVTRPPGYLLRIDPSQLDLIRFERLREQATAATARQDHEAARAALGQGLDLWHGEPLADMTYEAFAQAAIARLQELRLQVLEERIDADLALGRHGELIAELEALVSARPLRERLRQQQLLALYRADRQAEALDVYASARRALVDELGIEPGRALRELHGAILRQDLELDLASGAVATATPVPDARSPFVGRAAELGSLVAGLEDALSGRGRLLLVSGEPGIGKSRLAEELAGHARRRAARVLVGRCWEGGGAPAYWPWVQVLRAYAREPDTGARPLDAGPGAAELAALVPDLDPGRAERTSPAATEPDGARFRLFDGTVELLRRAAAHRPLVLVLDDLHAADPPSLLLLQFVARELGPLRVLIVASYRDVDPTPAEPLQAFLAAVAREPVTRRISLAGLAAGDVEAYLELAAADLASPQLATRLHRDSDGNPLFVAEMVRLLDEERTRASASRDAPTLAVPETIREVIGRRLANLSTECNRVLVLAAVLGPEFGVDALARLADVDENVLLDLLDEALDARVIADAPGAPGRLRFGHALTRATLYEDLAAARRVRLHRRALDALAPQDGAQRGAEVAELVYHAMAGHDFAAGAIHARAAAEQALSALAYEESARLYEVALDALAKAEEPDERARCELLLGLGEAHARAGRTSVAKAAFLDAAAAARRLGDARSLARAAAGYGGRVVWVRSGGDAHLVPLLEEGIAALGAQDVELRVRLLARLAGALRDDPSRDRRDACTREAIELARRSGSHTALLDALDGRVTAIVAPDTARECLELAVEMAEVAERGGDAERVAAAYAHRILARGLLGDMRGLEADLAVQTAIAEELRQPARRWEAVSSQAMVALAAGRLAEAEELSEQALAIGEATLPTGAVPVYRVQRYTLCDFRGRLPEVEGAMAELAAAYPARPVFRCVLAHLHAQLGRPAEARALLAELAPDDALPFDQEWIFAMSFLAEVAALLEDAAVAATLYARLAPWGALNVSDVGEGLRGSVERYLGLLAATGHRWPEADAHFEAAAAANDHMGAAPWLARTRADHARMLLARGTAGDQERARDLNGVADQAFAELGMARRTSRLPAGPPR